MISSLRLNYALLHIDFPSWPFRSLRLEQTVTQDGGYYSTMFQYVHVTGGLLSYVPYTRNYVYCEY